MATITEHISYTIWFTDPAEYQFALGVAENFQIKLSPRNAAALFDIPYPNPPSNPQLANKGMMFYFPNIPNTTTNITLAQSNPVLLNDLVDNFLVITTAGVPANIWPKGPDILLQWVGLVTQAAPISEEEDIPTIPQRRWINGFEWAPLQEGGSGNTEKFSRIASRTIDGHGFSLRGSNPIYAHFTNNFRSFGVNQPQQSWERIYVRFRRVGSSDFIFWVARGAFESGAHLTLTTGGVVQAYNRTGSGTGTLEGSFPIELDVWYRFDFILQMRTGIGTTGIFQLYVNGELAISFSKNDGQGINSAAFHQTSFIGNVQGSINHEIEIDYDDWTNQDWPVNGLGNLSLESVDWFVGTHIYRHNSVAVVANNWTGNTEVVNQGDAPINNLTTTLTSTTANAQIEALTDLGDIETLNGQNTSGISIGQVSALSGQMSRNSGIANGQLGYRIAGGATVLSVVNEQAADTGTAAAYLPSGLLLPVEITPFSIVKQKSSDAGVTINSSLVSLSENLGIWGPEDAPGVIDAENWPNRFMLHNCRYGNTGWGNIGSIPLAPVIAIGDTYVGNGTIQSITLPAPCHFLWICQPNAAGIVAFGSGLAANLVTLERTIPNIRIEANSLGQFFFKVHGNNANINQNGIVYQYIAFCDPGMRFNLCGAYGHSQFGTEPKINTLISENFLPQAAFIQREIVNVQSNTNGISYGLGGVGTNLGGTVLNPWADFAPGILSTYNNVHAAVMSQFNYSLWRTVEDCTGTMCQIFSYTGNGVSPRVINCSPLSGRFPLFAIVVPRSAGSGFYRTPSQTGSTSLNNVGAGTSTTGITDGGIDTITVGSSLNTNGIVYDCFIIPGSDTSWANGTFIASYCLPPLGPWEPPEDPIGDIIIMSEGGLSLGETATPTTILKDISGIYTLIPGKTNDTLIDRNESPIVDQIVKIPDPTWKTGYIGG